MFKLVSKLQKSVSMKQALLEKAILSTGSKSNYNFGFLSNQQVQKSEQLLTGQAKYTFSTVFGSNFLSLNQRRKGVQNHQSLYFVGRNTLFTQIFANNNNKVEKRIKALEQEIEEQMESMSGMQLLDSINELINLKTEFYDNDQYLGYVQDLQKKSNALYSLRQTNEALSILKQIEEQITETLSSVNSKKSKEIEQESTNLKIELANTILMRVQMQDAFCSEEEAKASVADCIKAISILEKVNQAESDHMVVAQQTLGETYYKLGNIQQSAQAIEKAAYLLDQLISEISAKQNKKQSKEQLKENELNMRHLSLRQAILYETLGNLHFDLRNMQQAEVFFTASLNIWENKISKNNNDQQDASTLDELVLKQAQQTIDNTQVNIHPLHMRCLNSIGTFYSTSGQTTKALQVLTNAKKYMHVATVENADNFSWVLLNMAKSYYKQQQYGTSYQLTLESEEVARQFQISEINLAQILEHKSSLLTMQAKHKESAETIDEALSLFKDNSQEPIYCRLLFSRGMQCIQTEQFEKAIQYAKKSKNLVESIRGPNDEQVGDALRIMGMANCSISLRNQNKNFEKDELFNNGIQYLEKAIQIFQLNNETRLQDQEAILGDLANIYEYTINFKKAIMYYEQQRSVRIHILESVGLPANQDQIVALIDEKIVSLYDKVNQPQKN